MLTIYGLFFGKQIKVEVEETVQCYALVRKIKNYFSLNQEKSCCSKNCKYMGEFGCKGYTDEI